MRWSILLLFQILGNWTALSLALLPTHNTAYAAPTSILSSDQRAERMVSFLITHAKPLHLSYSGLVQNQIDLKHEWKSLLDILDRLSLEDMPKPWVDVPLNKGSMERRGMTPIRLDLNLYFPTHLRILKREDRTLILGIYFSDKHQIQSGTERILYDGFVLSNETTSTNEYSGAAHFGSSASSKDALLAIGLFRDFKYLESHFKKYEWHKDLSVKSQGKILAPPTHINRSDPPSRNQSPFIRSPSFHDFTYEPRFEGDLQELLAKNVTLPLSAAHSLFKQVSFLHNQDIVHRDIKPENILYRIMSKDPHLDLDVKLIDFGFALDLSEGTSVRASSTRFQGTIDYSPPERSVPHEDHETHLIKWDSWSLALTVYRLLHPNDEFIGCIPLDHKTRSSHFRFEFISQISDYDRACTLCRLFCDASGTKSAPPLGSDTDSTPTLDYILWRMLNPNSDFRLTVEQGSCALRGNSVERCIEEQSSWNLESLFGDSDGILRTS